MLYDLLYSELLVVRFINRPHSAEDAQTHLPSSFICQGAEIIQKELKIYYYVSILLSRVGE